MVRDSQTTGEGGFDLAGAEVMNPKSNLFPKNKSERLLKLLTPAFQMEVINQQMTTQFFSQKYFHIYSNPEP